MKEYLFQPFKYIAGAKALMWGIIVMLLTVFVSYYSHIHFPDIVSVKTGPSQSFFYYAAQIISNIVIVSGIMYIMALIFSTSSVRMIDLLGTQSLARAPYLFATLTGFSDSLDQLGQFLIQVATQTHTPFVLPLKTITVAIGLLLFTLLMTIWMIALMYQGYKVSTNIKGSPLVITFIASLLLSSILSGVFNFLIIQKI